MPTKFRHSISRSLSRSDLERFAWWQSRFVAVGYRLHEIGSRQSVVKADGNAVPLPGRETTPDPRKRPPCRPIKKHTALHRDEGGHTSVADSARF